MNVRVGRVEDAPAVAVTRTPAHRFYAGLGYAQVKTQYSFVKPLEPGGADMASRLVPRVEPETR